MTTHGKDPTRVAAGLKAAINNPNVSEEGRERAADRLDGIDGGAHGTNGSTATTSVEDQHRNRELGGYKATLHNDRTSAQAKEHAREVLEAAGYTVEPGPGVTEDEHQTRVLAGYKAALNNPRVSEEAKQHAREYLNEYGA
ncbi:Conidiation protein 6-domain-containing protein [Fomitopsis serialis]|uniref:Conidiation protein 6-domain-containing protein n=1 Tax=Fomitopsis serialis TaxID=139415 RepID=UPI0020087150|nr:Conidiation protein 6-domain-containing protein [Neoantrodia serialis]KAH9924467.1 Conidiation protein 6-domain-containing protein [Neoantrodia serialis]